MTFPRVVLNLSSSTGGLGAGRADIRAEIHVVRLSPVHLRLKESGRRTMAVRFSAPFLSKACRCGDAEEPCGVTLNMASHRSQLMYSCHVVHPSPFYEPYALFLEDQPRSVP